MPQPPNTNGKISSANYSTGGWNYPRTPDVDPNKSTTDSIKNNYNSNVDKIKQYQQQSWSYQKQSQSAPGSASKPSVPSTYQPKGGFSSGRPINTFQTSNRAGGGQAELNRMRQFQYEPPATNPYQRPKSYSPPPSAMPSPPPVSGAASVQASALRAANVASKLPGGGKVAAAAAIVVAAAVAAWQNTRSKSETAGIYPGSGGSFQNGSPPFTGGQSPGVIYNVAIEGLKQTSPTSATIVQLALTFHTGTLFSITWEWVANGANLAGVRLFVSNASSTKIDTAINGTRWQPSADVAKISDIRITVWRANNTTDTGGDPPAPQIQYNGSNLKPNASGTTTSDGKPFPLPTPDAITGGRPSGVNKPEIANAPSPDEKPSPPPGVPKPRPYVPPPKIRFDFPSSSGTGSTAPGELSIGLAPGSVANLTTGTVNNDGQFQPSPNLGRSETGEWYYDTNGNLVPEHAPKGDMSFEANTPTVTYDTNGIATVHSPPASITNTAPKPGRVTNTNAAPVPSPSGTPIPQPGTIKPSEVKPPAATTTPDITPDLYKFLPLLALAPEMDKKLDDIKTTTTNIDQKPSPCLAPVYVPPVSAKVDTNIAATAALQTYTAAQTTSIKADTAATQIQVTEVNTKATAIQTATDTVLTKVGEVATSISKLWRLIGVDRWINYVNMALLFHNAFMLTNNLGQTAISAIENVFNLFGLKLYDDKGEEIDLSTLVGKTVESVAKAALGNENYTAMTTTWKKANRIYQTGMNVLYGVQSIGNSLQSLTQLAIENTGRIGNALRKAG